MRDFRDAKAMAQTLRSTLTPKGVNLSHTESLEVMAKVLGAKDWNVLSALIESSNQASRPGSSAADLWSLPLIPSRDFVLFPKMSAPIFVGRETSRQAVLETERGGLEVFIIAQKNPADDDPARDAIYDIGVIADVLDIIEVLPDPGRSGGSHKLMLRGRQRARLMEIRKEDGHLIAEVEPVHEVDDKRAAAEQMTAAVERFRALLSAGFANRGRPVSPGETVRLDPVEAAKLIARVEKITRPGALADMMTQMTVVPVPDKQAVLETLDPVARLTKAVALLRALPEADAP